MNFDLFMLNKYLMLEHDLDAIKVLLNRNKRYLKNNVIRTYLIKRCQMNLESTQKIKDNFLKYQTHMEKRLQELYEKHVITQEELAAIKEYISSVLTICDTALQKKPETPHASRINPLRYSISWKTITICTVATLGIAYYVHTHAKAPQESTTK